MSKLLEKSMDELCANTIDTVDRIMGRYNVGWKKPALLPESVRSITVSGKKMYRR